MKKILLFTALLCTVHLSAVRACTCDPWSGSFKETLMRASLGWFGDPASTPYVVKAVLLEYSPDSFKSKVLVLQQFRGPLTLDTITFRGGNGANCYDNMFHYAVIPGDTVIALMLREAIDHPGIPRYEGEFYNEYCNRNFMRIENGSAVDWDGSNGTSIPLPDLQDSVDHIFANPVSVHELAKAGQVNIFPNPAIDEVQILLENVDIKEVKLYDLQGKQIVRQQLTGKSNTLYTKGLSPGIYLLHATDKDGVVYRKKMLKR